MRWARFGHILCLYSVACKSTLLVNLRHGPNYLLESVVALDTHPLRGPPFWRPLSLALHLFLASVFGAKMVLWRWPDLFVFPPRDGGMASYTFIA